ncbi:hypothetical protein COB57_03075 [Candidatus Peregrinibacteria bacterium]|nr:MAG: hypothetical protein COB57_03075 [Candidatus Peregrinibacteria bacterium]
MKKLIISLFGLFISIPAFAAMQSSDGIAGYPVFFEAEGKASSEYVLEIQKPNKAVIILPALSNSHGDIETEIEGYHTKIAGIYSVNIAKKGESFTPHSVFRMYPDVFSKNASSMQASEKSLSESEALQMSVFISDRHNNPLAGHIIRLLSSRGEDTIIAANDGITDEKGFAQFSITTKIAGISIFTAFNNTVGQELQNREKVVFYEQSTSFSFGGDDLSANIMSSSSNNSFNIIENNIIDHFTITFPDTILVDDEQNFLIIEAQDKNNKTVRSYNGTIRIEIEGDDNALIPHDGQYAFQEQDQGKKKFDLAMRFTTTGSKTIRVFDYDDGTINESIMAEKTVNVILENAPIQNNTGNNADGLTIKYPTNGSQLSIKNINISGMADKNTPIRVFFDKREVANTTSDFQGFFSYVLQNLRDGEHELYVMQDNGSRSLSESVFFTIDASAPQIDNITVSPNQTVLPEENIKVSIVSEPELDYVHVRLAGILEILTETIPGTYEKNMLAPKAPGEYDGDVILADTMGNISTNTAHFTLTVAQKEIPNAPTNLRSTAGDQNITLSWDYPETNKKIDFYSIFIGSSQDTLHMIQKTSATQVQLTQMENGKTYYVAVSATNTEGSDSVFSTIISATPKAPEVVHTSAPEQNELRGVAGNGKVTLYWDDMPNTNKYTIFIGVQSKKYEVQVSTEKSTIIIPDLFNDIPYYFELKATDNQGKQLSLNEISLTPQGYGFAITPSTKDLSQKISRDFSKEKNIKGTTGPESIFLIVFSFIFAWFVYRKKQYATISSTTYAPEEKVLQRTTQKKIQF